MRVLLRNRTSSDPVPRHSAPLRGVFKIRHAQEAGDEVIKHLRQRHEPRTVPYGISCTPCWESGWSSACAHCCGTGRQPIPFVDVHHAFVWFNLPRWRKEWTK